MLMVKYTKKDSACYVSHVDTLRTVNRIFNRADVKVDYSEGFNPHVLVYFSPPNVVGVQSECEYFALSTNDTNDFINRFNQNAPQGFVATQTWLANKNPNLAKEVDKAEYIINCKDIGKIDLGKLLSQDKFEVSFKDKEGLKTKDYKDFVLDAIKIDDDSIKVLLKFGNINLRADRFVDGLVQNFGLTQSECNIVKTQVFVGDKTVDEFLNDFCK